MLSESGISRSRREMFRSTLFGRVLAAIEKRSQPFGISCRP